MIWIIAGYFVIGFLCALAVSISAHYHNNDDDILVFPLIVMWPIVILMVGLFNAVSFLGEWIADRMRGY